MSINRRKKYFLRSSNLLPTIFDPNEDFYATSTFKPNHQVFFTSKTRYLPNVSDVYYVPKCDSSKEMKELFETLARREQPKVRFSSVLTIIPPHKSLSVKQIKAATILQKGTIPRLDKKEIVNQNETQKLKPHRKAPPVPIRKEYVEIESMCKSPNPGGIISTQEIQTKFKQIAERNVEECLDNLLKPTAEDDLYDFPPPPSELLDDSFDEDEDEYQDAIEHEDEDENDDKDDNE